MSIQIPAKRKRKYGSENLSGFIASHHFDFQSTFEIQFICIFVISISMEIVKDILSLSN